MGCFVIFSVVLVLLDGGSISRADGQAAGHVVGWWRSRHGHWVGLATEGGADGHGGRQGAVGGIETGLNEIFTFRLGDERLEFCGGEGVDETSLGDDEKENLGASERRELVSLKK